MKKTLTYISVGAFWLLVWQIISMIAGAELILPSPVATITAFFALAKTGGFYLSAVFSVFRIMLGFVLGVLLGMLLGVLCSFNSWFNAVFSPLRNIIKATPVSSFILILLFWLDKQLVPSCIAMLIVLPIIHSAVYEGISSTDKLLLEMARVYKVPHRVQLRTIYLESVKSRLFAAMATSLGLAWKAGVAAEVLATPNNAIGTALYESKTYLETANLFAWTMLVIILSVLLERLMLFLLDRIKGRGYGK